jgi:hypothetical protein
VFRRSGNLETDTTQRCSTPLLQSESSIRFSIQAREQAYRKVRHLGGCRQIRVQLSSSISRRTNRTLSGPVATVGGPTRQLVQRRQLPTLGKMRTTKVRRLSSGSTFIKARRALRPHSANRLQPLFQLFPEPPWPGILHVAQLSGQAAQSRFQIRLKGLVGWDAFSGTGCRFSVHVRISPGVRSKHSPAPSIQRLTQIGKRRRRARRS